MASGASAAAGGDVEVVLGPALIPPVDPGLVFIRVLDSWAIGPWCVDEADAARAALHQLQTMMFDGSTAFIASSFRVTGPLDSTRTFALRDDVDKDIETVRRRGRDIMSMALLATRAALPLARAVARYRHFVLRLPLPIQRSRAGISSEMAAVDAVVLNKTTVATFAALPPDESWTSWEGQVWWGLWMATAPPERLRDAFQRLVVRVGERYRAAHSDAFTDRIGWELRYRSAPRDADRDDESGGEPSRKRRRGRGRIGTMGLRFDAPRPHVLMPSSPRPMDVSGIPSSGASVGGRGRGAPFGGRFGATGRGPMRGRAQGSTASTYTTTPRS
jgi:hypothetical protein